MQLFFVEIVWQFFSWHLRRSVICGLGTRPQHKFQCCFLRHCLNMENKNLLRCCSQCFLGHLLRDHTLPWKAKLEYFLFEKLYCFDLQGFGGLSKLGSLIENFYFEKHRQGLEVHQCNQNLNILGNGCILENLVIELCC